ncbi:acyltransferase [Aquibium sp. ELW1220]|uniref:acyltransferase n=1 Tax=Aquibium sp. ELW1220 TaxID=2976766 RepID=UPI0025AFC2DC|nr:acyltransferase [Aquibium sp. ELW1220]MDN2583268.1 acyltransferase [Aquibium sp. ELW1220]
MKIYGGGYLQREELLDLGIRSIGENVRVHEKAILVDVERIEFGSNVRIDAFCVLSAAGGSLRIGSYVHLASHADIYAGAGVVLEDFAGLSQGVRIYSVSDDYSGACLTNPTVPRGFLVPKAGCIRIGRHVIVGSGSVVLPGCSIGDGSAVGALSLVNRSLDPWGVYAGSPARRIRARSRKLLAAEGAMAGDGVLALT